ncbi:MAG: branched-chain amino acid transaminase [Myxococcales bacterium]|nr:branched-chain amino acid transaminase [Myxococcales bacterium]
MQADFLWMDGELIPFGQATIHVLTHTLHYGFGVFEGIRAYQREDGTSHVFRLQEHVKRLFESAHIIGLEIPYDAASLERACTETLVANGLAKGYLRPIAFLGSDTLGLGALNNKTHVAVGAWDWGAYLGEEGMAKGIRCKISSFSRLHVNVNMVKGKICGQYVNSVIAKREVLKAGYDEAIMLDTQGYVSECTGENLFMVKNGKIITAAYGSSILGGITRDTILALAGDLGIPVQERLFTRDELYVADEVFLCGTAAEITPVREIDDRTIGGGRPGEVTLAVSKKFFGVVRGDDPARPEWRATYTLKA